METVTLDNNLGDSLENIELRAASDENLQDTTEKQAAIEAKANEPIIDHKAECTLMVNFTFDNLVGIYPALESIYTTAKREEIAGALVPVCQAYGWSLGGLTSTPWFGLLIVSVPLIAPTYAAIKQGNKTVNTIVSKHDLMQPIIDQTDASSLHNRA